MIVGRKKECLFLHNDRYGSSECLQSICNPSNPIKIAIGLKLKLDYSFDEVAPHHIEVCKDRDGFLLTTTTYVLS